MLTRLRNVSLGPGLTWKFHVKAGKALLTWSFHVKQLQKRLNIKTCLSKGTGSAFYFGAVADQFACIVEKLEKRILRYAMLYYTILYYELLCYDMLCSALHCTALHWTLPYSTLLYSTVLYCTIYYTILYLCTCTEEKPVSYTHLTLPTILRV